MNEPLVTINILSFNRKEELRNTLQKVYDQDYKNIEVIVVDNASSDGSPEMIELEFPKIKLIPLSKNIGIAGWNEGFKAAIGEYVLVLDDDSYPDKRTIEDGVCTLEKNNFAAAAFNVINIRTGNSETEDFNKINPFSFIGCGALIRRNVLEEVGYYDPDYFIYLNEIDLCIRIYEAGYKMIYLNENKVYHSQSPLSRNDKDVNPFSSRFRYYHHFLGWYIFLIKHFSFKYSFKYLIKWIINRFIICFKYPYLYTFFKALLIVLIRTPKILRERKIVSSDLQRYYNYGKTAFIDRWFFPDFKKDKIKLNGFPK